VGAPQCNEIIGWLSGDANLETHIFFKIFDIVNCLQGVIIFLMLFQNDKFIKEIYYWQVTHGRITGDSF
jgi:hypothetical protein